MQAIAAAPPTPFYTPGHKHGRGIASALHHAWGAAIFAADMPELPGLDNLLAPDGVIGAAQDLAAAYFGAQQTYFLANGSTSGIEAAILATVAPGDRLIVPRNAHRSVFSGLVLSGAEPVLIEPDYDPEWDLVHGLAPDRVAQALQTIPGIKAILTVSPTYHGVCGDIAALVAMAHAHDLPLLVDAAHGAHFVAHPDLPTPALALGVDLVVQSSHKTLGALTQAAMLHVQGERINRDRLQQTLNLVQSTSPSYLLLASLDAARHQLATQGRLQWQAVIELARQLRRDIAALPDLRVLTLADLAPSPGAVALDTTRITVDISAWGISGYAADAWLSDRGVIVELPTLRHLTLILSVGNTPVDGVTFCQALTELRSQLRLEPTQPLTRIESPAPITRPACTPRAAFFATHDTVAIAAAMGRISAELICPYPPGIPLLLPGELITSTAIATLEHIQQQGGLITGASDPSLQTLKVVRQ